MRIINRPRQGGKTTELIHLMAKDDTLVYVASTQRMADYAHQQSKITGFDIDRERFVSITSLRMQQPTTYPNTRFVIDELDNVLEALLGAPALAAALTGEVS